MRGQLESVPSIQFATGLLYRPHAHELLVSYGELDCYATLARFPLTATLEATLGRRQDDVPTTLVTSANLTLGRRTRESKGTQPDG